jgi:hypothetical protein
MVYLRLDHTFHPERHSALANLFSSSSVNGADAGQHLFNRLIRSRDGPVPASRAIKSLPLTACASHTSAKAARCASALVRANLYSAAQMGS